MKLLEVQKLKDIPEHVIKNIVLRSNININAIIKELIEPMAQEFEYNSFAALQKYMQKFDKKVPKNIILEKKELKRALDRFKKEKPLLLNSFEVALSNVTSFHRLQLPKDIDTEIAENHLGLKYKPFDNVALYVPGGKAIYPSTVYMGIIPAVLAKVKNIFILSPPSASGNVNDSVAALAYLAGADRILQAGGAQAILSAAYGIPELDFSSVDFIYGPGNKYVAAAKSYCMSRNFCGIDSFAGPSEVIIIADKSANAKFLAQDLLAQAEHDEDAMSILLCDDENVAQQTCIEIENAIEERNSERKKITTNSIKKNGKVFLVDDINEAITFSNNFSPEHLEIQTENDDAVLSKISSAGSVFLGAYSPVAIGDYYSGTNHILPTGRAAKFASGVSTLSFFRRITYQRCSETGLKKAVDHVARMSKEEGLYDAHGYSLLARFK